MRFKQIDSPSSTDIEVIDLTYSSDESVGTDATEECTEFDDDQEPMKPDLERGFGKHDEKRKLSVAVNLDADNFGITAVVSDKASKKQKLSVSVKLDADNVGISTVVSAK